MVLFLSESVGNTKPAAEIAVDCDLALPPPQRNLSIYCLPPGHLTDLCEPGAPLCAQTTKMSLNEFVKLFAPLEHFSYFVSYNKL